MLKQLNTKIKTEKSEKTLSRRVYIRHANKNYSNGESDLYKHDPGITDEGAESCKKVAECLIKKWGIPDIIIASPYRRTRETVQIMISSIDEKSKSNIQVFIDSEVSEYLGNHREFPIDVTDNTMVYNPPHPETFKEMKNRVRRHHNHINDYIERIDQEKVIWIITHGLIIKQIASFVGLKMAKEFATLTCLSIMEFNNVTNTEILLFHDQTKNNIDVSDENENVW